MILDKFFAASLICLMTDTPLVEIHTFTKEFIDLEESKLFVLDNDNKPHRFESIYSTTNIDVVDDELDEHEKGRYFNDVENKTAHAYAVIWRQI